MSERKTLRVANPAVNLKSKLFCLPRILERHWHRRGESAHFLYLALIADSAFQFKTTFHMNVMRDQHPLSQDVTGGIAMAVMQYNQLLRNQYEIQQAIRRLTLLAMSVVHLIWESPTPWISWNIFRQFDVPADGTELWTNLYAHGISAPFSIVRAELGALLTGQHAPNAQVAWLCVQGWHFHLPQSFTYAHRIRRNNTRLAHYVLAQSISQTSLDSEFLEAYLECVSEAVLQLLRLLPQAERDILEMRNLMIGMHEVRCAVLQGQLEIFCSWHDRSQDNPFRL